MQNDIRTRTSPKEFGDNAGDLGISSDRDSNATSRFRRVLSAGTLAGDRVRNGAGDDLGTIEEIMLDVTTGRVAYAVLSFGGFLGIGDKLFAIPWEALELNEAEHEFVLDVDKQQLENAPGFDKNNWPDMADTSWGSMIHSHYGRTPYWEQTGSDRTRSAAGVENDVSNETWRESSNLQRDFPSSSTRESSIERPRTYAAGSTSTGQETTDARTVPVTTSERDAKWPNEDDSLTSDDRANRGSQTTRSQGRNV